MLRPPPPHPFSHAHLVISFTKLKNCTFPFCSGPSQFSPSRLWNSIWIYRIQIKKFLCHTFYSQAENLKLIRGAGESISSGLMLEIRLRSQRQSPPLQRMCLHKTSFLLRKSVCSEEPAPRTQAGYLVMGFYANSGSDCVFPHWWKFPHCLNSID